MVTTYIWLVGALLIEGVISQAKDKIKITASERDDRLSLKCDKECTWRKDDIIVSNRTELNLGSLWNDPRGLYCLFPRDGSGKQCVDVYVRRCLNCIQMDAGTIAGFIVADVIMIALIATAVYFVSGSETRRPGRGSPSGPKEWKPESSDKQNLIERDTEYQVLGRRDNDQYSHLAPRAKRGGF